MKEELLNELKKEFEQKKKQVIEYNQKVKRIKELAKTPEVKEYLYLCNQVDGMKEQKMQDRDITSSIYHNYLYRIDKDETNGIYVYRGTYRISDEIDIVHGARDIRVNYHSSLAYYRQYYDIEQIEPINIPINQCEQFEKEHTILYLDYFGRKFYTIQEEFFTKAITKNQDVARKYILRKYRK